MVEVVQFATNVHGVTTMHVDFAVMEEPMIEALRRSQIFLAYAFNVTKRDPLDSITLEANIEFDVGAPNPIPPEQRAAYRQAYSQWSIGQGLLELDQALERFIQSAIKTVAQLDAFETTGEAPPADPKPHQGNTWKVHQGFYTAVAEEPRQPDDGSFLRSLGNARNCLAHDGGVVTPKRLLKGETQMAIRWPGRDMHQRTVTGEKRLLPRDVSFVVRSDDVGLELSTEEVIRERLYSVGDTVLFSAVDLSEILFFYQILAIRVGAASHQYFYNAMARISSSQA